jgi:starch phosphorylase
MPSRVIKQKAIDLIENNLKKYFNTDFKSATNEQIFRAMASVAMDELFEIRCRAKHVAQKKGEPKRPAKALHYLTMEVLPGKTLESTLVNLGWNKVFADALKSKGINIQKIYNIETDAGLGNGGLGRLAACYMDSLATLGYPSTTHCIKYSYGLFKQRIIDGQQVEFLDEWLDSGSVWLTARPEESVIVRFGGTVSSVKGADGKLKFTYLDTQDIEAIPYEMMFSGYEAKIVSILKLWHAQAKSKGDIHISHLEVAYHMREYRETEMINSILYPSNETLRLKQQYFLCSASMQSVIKWHIKKGIDIKKLYDYVAIHINDTHPTMVIPELMRILMDDYGFGWDESWDITTKCVSYTNHTILQEALEVWEIDLLKRRVPRIFQIICEIDRRWRDRAVKKYKYSGNIEDIAIVSNNLVRMAHLAVVASHKVNGVAKIHTDILKTKLFKHFASAGSHKFINITNGITPRRWLVQCNPLLTEFLTSQIGTKFITDTSLLAKIGELEPLALKQFMQIKQANKHEFAKWLKNEQGIEINPESRFDVHVKRIHEYKRQLLNVLRIIHLYNQIKGDPTFSPTPQTFIFGGKAAASYYLAKRIIKLINQVGAEIDNDERANRFIKVVFVENFSVNVSEKLLPAVDVSVQISLAGQEASGTGNMKAAINGALMICTYDGANAEIVDEAAKSGIESNFVFGLRQQDINEFTATQHNPVDMAHKNPKIMAVIDALNTGFNGESFRDIASYLLGTNNNNDQYLCLADFQSFIDAHERMDALYKKPLEWAKAAINNVKSVGYFSSDRAVEEYANEVWGLLKLR